MIDQPIQWHLRMRVYDQHEGAEDARISVWQEHNLEGAIAVEQHAPEAPLPPDCRPAGQHELFDGCSFQIQFLRIPWVFDQQNEIRMIAVLTKPADRIGPGDIQALIAENVPESAQIEFKESLPAGKGKADAWLNGDSGIGDHARNRILEEVVAFANAYGGALVLGIAEDGAKPPLAAILRAAQNGWNGGCGSVTGDSRRNSNASKPPTTLSGFA